MKHYKTVNDFTLIKRHILLLIISILKSLFLILVSILLYYIWNKYFLVDIETELVKYLFFWVVFLLINYSFLSLISSIVEYYNNLVVLYKDRIIILQSSLILKDNIEIIYIHKVVKINWSKIWVFQNILWYWNITIEEQNNNIRILNFISKPNSILKLLNSQKDKYLLTKNINNYSNNSNSSNSSNNSNSSNSSNSSNNSNSSNSSNNSN